MEIRIDARVYNRVLLNVVDGLAAVKFKAGSPWAPG
jgi:hypothetical protein